VSLIYTHTNTHFVFIIRVPIILSFSFQNKCKPQHLIYRVVFISVAGRTKLELQKHVIFYCSVINKIHPVRIKKESQKITLCFGTCFKFISQPRICGITIEKLQYRIMFVLSSLVQQTLVGQVLFIVETSQSYSDTPRSIWLPGWVISPSQRLLTTYNIHYWQTSMLLAGFEPAIPTSERTQTDDFRVAIGINGWDTFSYFTVFILFTQPLYSLCVTLVLHTRTFVTPT
jgi:hypothetical protein